MKIPGNILNNKASLLIKETKYGGGNLPNPQQH